MRLALELAEISRETLPKEKALFARISASDLSPSGETDAEGNFISWGIEQSKVLLAELSKRGVSLLDCSSSGNDNKQQIEVKPGYQVPFAEQLRKSLNDQNRIPISAVGLITEGKQAEQYLQEGKADVVS